MKTKLNSTKSYNIKNNLKNTNGSAVISALMSVLAVTGLAYLVMELSGIASQRILVMRTKSIMAIVEHSVRMLAMQPQNYTGCTATGASSCVFAATTAFSGFDVAVVEDGIYGVRVPGAICDVGEPYCGVVIEAIPPTVLDPTDPGGFGLVPKITGGTTEYFFRARIRYTGSNFRLRPLDINLEVPVEILQTDNFNCPMSRPIFGGFQNGSPICRTLSPACPAGQYIQIVNNRTLATTCATIPTSARCTNNSSFITRFTWDGAANMTVQCSARRNPYGVTEWWP